MRKAAIISLVSLMATASFAAKAEEQPTGHILVPNGGSTRLYRCDQTFDSEGAQGRTGWLLEVTPGKAFALEAAGDESIDDFDISFFSSMTDCLENAAGVAGHTNRSGDEAGVVPADATISIVSLFTGLPGAGFFYRESDLPPPTIDPPPQAADMTARSFTVIAVLDSGFSPYHFDFLGQRHPWNLDPDPSNDLDFYAPPSSYISGHPGSNPINITIPTSPGQDISGLRAGADASEWAKLQVSSATNLKLFHFPGTKIIGAASFSGGFYDTNDGHGTRSAAVAGGNIHGTCSECLFVLVKEGPGALAWAASQPWIDVVTNSYGHSVVGGAVRDNIYFGAPVDATKAGSEAGQFVVFSAGNGLLNAFDVPMLTYWSSEKGPDWTITVGAVSPSSRQTYSGAGKPVDISSIGSAYPSTGGSTASGEGQHSGTSNAAPVTAGTIARVILEARMALGDVSEGHAAGGVASGAAVSCGAVAGCPIGDGAVTRAEVQEVVFLNVLPSATRISAGTVWPTTPYSYYYQGRGVIPGIIDRNEQNALISRMSGVLRGNLSSYLRPAAETNWFVVDSKCRQILWGRWNGGYWQGTDPELNPADDPIATPYSHACNGTSEQAFGALKDLL